MHVHRWISSKLWMQPVSVSHRGRSSSWRAVVKLKTTAGLATVVCTKPHTRPFTPHVIPGCSLLARHWVLDEEDSVSLWNLTANWEMGGESQFVKHLADRRNRGCWCRNILGMSGMGRERPVDQETLRKQWMVEPSGPVVLIIMSI